MVSLAPSRSSGTRRYDQFSAIAERLANRFQGADDISPTKLLNALKRAAPYVGISRTLIDLMDELIAHSRRQDWKPGKVPLVWPRNETLARRLSIGIRQLQNLLRQAVEMGLIVAKDSPNGHRGGCRDAEGEIVWGYGFDLRPLGTRNAEFEAIAARGAAEDREIARLRRMLSAARRRARMLADTVERSRLEGIDAGQELELVRMAIAHIHGSRDIDQLGRCVALLDDRVKAFQQAVDASLANLEATNSIGSASDISVDNSPKGVSDFMHSTTTSHLQTARAVTSRGSPKECSAEWDFPILVPQSDVEADLARRGVDPAFIAKSCPYLVLDLEPGPRAWGRIVSIAEDLVGRHEISLHAWKEACRLMGHKGAAAAVIATVQKHWSAEVRSPGAYLRGMSARAETGELNLGKTYHGLREAHAGVIP